MIGFLPWTFAGSSDAHILYRGRIDESTQVRYMAVQDTSLDASMPTEAVGGATVLRSGNSNVILIEFRDLQATFGVGKEIVDARLVLTQIVGTDPDSVSVRELVVPWSEGPAQIVTFGRPVAEKLPTGSATYRARRELKSPMDWQQPGAQGPGDSVAVEGVTFRTIEGARLEISGLAKSLQSAYENPDEKFGYAIRISGGLSEFFSSESPVGQPALVVTTRDRELSTLGPQIVGIKRIGFPSPPKPAKIREVEQDGQKLSIPEFAPGISAWPAKGTPVTIEATVLAGAGPRKPMEARWMVNDRWGSWFRVDASPQADSTLTLKTEIAMPTWSTLGDLDAVRLQVRSEGASNSDSEALYLKGLGVAVDIEESLVAAMLKSPAHAKLSAETAVRMAVRSFNEVSAPRSRSGPFPQGSFARLNVERVRIVPDKPGIQTEPDVADRLADVDAHIVLDSELDLSKPLGRDIQRAILNGLGLADWNHTLQPYAFMNSSARPGLPTSAFGGLLGGDTRFEGMIPGGITIPAEPVENPILDIANPRPSGLLSIIDVAQLNHLAESRQRQSLTILGKTPPLSTVRCLDANGRPLAGAQVRFYAMAQGQWMPEPLATGTASDAGNVSLFNRKLGSESTKTPMGWIHPNGSNGWLLVEVERFGVRDYGWISLPLLVEANLRSPNLPALFDLRFNLSNGVPDTTNLALKKFVGDSANGLPATLAQLVDGDFETSYPLPTTNGGYIEIDLGRDRVIGEVKLVGTGWWDAFDVFVYATGQTINEAVPWAKERNFGWSFRNRSRPEGNHRTVAYRAAGQKIRYVRIVNRTESAKAAKGNDVAVFGLQGPTN